MRRVSCDKNICDVTFSASRELEAVVARGFAVAVGGMLSSAGDTSYLT